MFKKAVFFSISLIAVSVFVSSAAYATSKGTCSSIISDFKGSANVACYYQSDTDQLNYGVATGHTSGNRIYKATNVAGDIYYTTDSAITSSDVSGACPTAGASTLSGTKLGE